MPSSRELDAQPALGDDQIQAVLIQPKFDTQPRIWRQEAITNWFSIFSLLM
jgi:hypothetical protein